MNVTVVHVYTRVHVLMVSTSTHVSVQMVILGNIAKQILTNAGHLHAKTMDSAETLTDHSTATVQRLDIMALCVKAIRL